MEVELRTQSRGNCNLLTPAVEQLGEQLKPGAHDTYAGKGAGWKDSSFDIKEVAEWWPEAQNKLNKLLKEQEGKNPAVKQLRGRVAALPSDEPLRIRVRYGRAGVLEGCLWLVGWHVL